MRIEVVPQFEMGNVHRIRVGDFLNQQIAVDIYNRFRFAVAYMRVSGLDRIAATLETLLNRGGTVSGAIGIDDSITSLEALEALLRFSGDSTIFHTASGFIYHPKLYLIDGEKEAVVVIGSANLTRDGLFRNVEIATAVFMDFEASLDYEVYQRYDAIFLELLNTRHPNIQPVNIQLLSRLNQVGLIKREAETREPGVSIKRIREQPAQSSQEKLLQELFPNMQVPTAPPGFGLATTRITSSPYRPQIVTSPPPTIGNISTFLMQLSSFDSSHRLGVPGTAEVLIPLDAQSFFPTLSLQANRIHPDANFDVILNLPIGQERHSYRVWFYKGKDEFRLRMNKDTIELSSPTGGDLLVINKLPSGSDPPYEVTILSQTDPTFPAFLQKCKNISQGKRWGVVTY
jgi:HKD family nuclease